MKSKTFATALWTDSLEKACRGDDGCVQGVASFDEADGVKLNIPFGEILGDRWSVVIGGPELPYELDWLYGFSQDGYRLAMKHVVFGGTSRSYPGGPHQELRAEQLFYSKYEFDPTKMVTGATLEITGLAEWLGFSPL